LLSSNSLFRVQYDSLILSVIFKLHRAKFLEVK